jgi:L-aminopeptidase/D-esterase-like protein
MDELSRAVIESVEEAVLNSLFCVETVIGCDDHIAYALPVEEVIKLIACSRVV